MSLHNLVPAELSSLISLPFLSHGTLHVDELPLGHASDRQPLKWTQGLLLLYTRV